ncbi:BON domain-containing protein [Bdellovibrio reynosensis]|uniref:BON domain-containing protein n=1 Tax=Bdellovibrio reynosensis TaxID=2835041 RepID=A0ABY4C9Z6_9BACT|nr:BON domain-containing protein [Bdellovibrio reynosensis]UOF01791.1 BON domain-containing protein [Bdellovibrio reynosensis]
MPNQRNYDRSSGNQGRYSRSNERQDWYENDPMDERSGYRGEDDDYQMSRNQHQRYRSNDDRGYSRGGGSRRGGQSEYYEQSRFGREEGYRDRDRNDRMDYEQQDRYSQFGYGAQTGEQNFGQFNQSGYSQESQRNYTGRGPKGFKRSDERIKEEICEILTRHPEIDAENIDVEVSEAKVTLEGAVPDRRMKYLAEDAIEHSFGVQEVTNNLRVQKSEEREERQSESRSSGSEKSSSKKSGSSSSSSNH